MYIYYLHLFTLSLHPDKDMLEGHLTPGERERERGRERERERERERDVL